MRWYFIARVEFGAVRPRKWRGRVDIRMLRNTEEVG